MESTAFANYLIEIGRQTPASANTRKRKCEKIEEAEGDLDAAFAEDGLHRIYHLLDYTKEDVANGVPQRHSIPIGGNKGFQSIYDGTKDHQSSLSKYIEFKKYIQENPKELERLRSAASARTAATNGEAKHNSKRAEADWPSWSGPNEEERLSLSRIITKYVRFLNPDIVDAVVQDNMRQMARWHDLLEQCGIDSSQYLWDGSPCCFPGVRRHSGTKEINAFRGKTQEFDNAISLDDNSYPKQIWSYVFRDSGFSNYGPKGYQLAHLIDHKDTTSRFSSELISKGGERIEAVPGLFTCATNAVYVPTDFLKPTDFESGLRGLLQRKAFDLYSDVSQPLPSGMNVVETEDPRWRVEAFEWPQPVGTLDYVEDFLRYRNAKMEELFEKRKRALLS